MKLVHKAHERPKHLSPDDLEPLRRLVGNDAVDYALVLASFHFITRIADLLHVDAEVMPESLRRFEWLRRASVRIMGLALGTTMDLGNRGYGKSYADAMRDIGPVFSRALGRPPGDELASLSVRPKLVEVMQQMIEERTDRSSLAPDVLVRVHEMVEEALPSRAEDIEGFHQRPADPVEAFAFVGTRYAARTTETMIDALRRTGYDDLGILDLAIAIADGNSWARLYRLLDLPSDIGYASDAAVTATLAHLSRSPAGDRER